MPSVSQIISFFMSCKGQQNRSDKKKETSRNKSQWINKWIRFGEDILSATEEALSDLIKIINPTLHDEILKLNQDNSKDILNSSEDHKEEDDITGTLLQSSIRSAIRAAVQDAVKIKNLSSSSKDLAEFKKDSKESVNDHDEDPEKTNS